MSTRGATLTELNVLGDQTGRARCVKPYDPGTLASSANRCILGKVYLRSNISSKQPKHRPGKVRRVPSNPKQAAWGAGLEAVHVRRGSSSAEVQRSTCELWTSPVGFEELSAHRLCNQAPHSDISVATTHVPSRPRSRSTHFSMTDKGFQQGSSEPVLGVPVDQNDSVDKLPVVSAGFCVPHDVVFVLQANLNPRSTEIYNVVDSANAMQFR